MAKKETLTAAEITRDINKSIFKPIYILQGEESFYIDNISELILEKALTEDEKDFNLSIFYGLDSDVRDIINACKRYPLMAQHQVVMIREAQLLKEIDLLQHYVKQPLHSTILVICNKGGNLKATETLKLAKASNDVIIFESKKVTDANVAKVINDYVKECKCTIGAKALSMLKDYIGTDISRITGEIDKLVLILNQNNQSEITAELIERNIGISKDFNNFEFEQALREKNMLRAMRIIDYFQKNPKNNPTVVTISLLFSFFSSVLLVHTCKDRSESGLMAQLETRSAYRARIFAEATRKYSALACIKIISYIREFDTKSKGINSRQNEYDLLRELTFKILNS
ncbi:MAG: DNA polymerase III subunit delta [Bacteroidales bacterium]